MKKGAAWLALSVSVALLAPPVVAHAAASETDRQREIQTTISRLRDELGEVAANEAELLADLRVTQRSKAEEEAKLTAIDANMAAVRAELDTAQATLDRAAAAERSAQRRLQKVRDQLETARQTLKSQAVASFMRFGAGAEQLDVVLRAHDIQELHHASAFVDTLADTQARVVNEFVALEGDTAALETSASTTRHAAAAQRDEVDQRTSALEAARQAQAEATMALGQWAAHEQSVLDQVRSRRSDYERRIREQQRESDSIAALLRSRGSPGPQASGVGSLGAPLANPVITSTFGYRIHPIFGDRRLHSGLDFRAGAGTPIVAAAPGEVVFAGMRGGYGNCVIIDHGGGVATLYAHQSAIRVRTGQQVGRGEVIGAAGATGFATGPHLHFEVRANGTPVDPLAYL